MPAQGLLPIANREFRAEPQEGARGAKPAGLSRNPEEHSDEDVTPKGQRRDAPEDVTLVVRSRRSLGRISTP